jgi:hypothetical protein
VDEVGGDLDTNLSAFVPDWLASAWTFVAPRFIGRDLSWPEWLALPAIAEQP